MAVGTIAVTSRSPLGYSFSGSAKRCEVVSIDWTASSTDGSLPVLQVALSGWLVKVVTNPGSVAPTANYDIDLADPNDANLSATGTLLNNRHTTTTEQVYPVISGAVVPIFLAGTYGVTITNNSVNSATGNITFYMVDSI